MFELNSAAFRDTSVVIYSAWLTSLFVNNTDENVISELSSKSWALFSLYSGCSSHGVSQGVRGGVGLGIGAEAVIVPSVGLWAGGHQGGRAGEDVYITDGGCGQTGEQVYYVGWLDAHAGGSFYLLRRSCGHGPVG